MSTKEWAVGYDEGYQQGWNDAMDETPAEANEPVAYIEHHKAGDNLVWDNPGANSTPLYTSPPAYVAVGEKYAVGVVKNIKLVDGDVIIEVDEI